MEVKIKKLTETAKLPTRGSEYAAGYDLYADSINIGEKDWTLVIEPGQTAKIGTGVAVAIPEGYFGGIYARSGLAIKNGLAPGNCVGVLDADYRGELIVALHNHSNTSQFVHPGDRIAQLIIQPYASFTWDEVEELDDTERGDGGFGSTGV